MGWGKPARQVSPQTTRNQEAKVTQLIKIKMEHPVESNGKGKFESWCSPFYFAKDTNL